MIFETAMDKEQSFVAVIIINARAFIATLSWERPKVKRVRIGEKSKRKSGKRSEVSTCINACVVFRVRK